MIVRTHDQPPSPGYACEFLITHIKLKKKKIIVPKKCLLLTLSYLSILSLQTGTKLTKSLKVILNCRKLHKSQNKLANAFRFKGYILQELKTGDIYKFNIWMLSWWMCNGHVRIEEIIGILPLTKKISAERDMSLVITCYFESIRCLLTGC